MGENRSWRLAVRHKLEDQKHNHILESEAVVLALRWFLRFVGNQGCQVIILADKKALIGALRKGGSSPRILNKLCRNGAALVLAGSLYPVYYYARSAKNPAFAPQLLLS